MVWTVVVDVLLLYVVLLGLLWAYRLGPERGDRDGIALMLLLGLAFAGGIPVAWVVKDAHQGWALVTMGLVATAAVCVDRWASQSG